MKLGQPVEELLGVKRLHRPVCAEVRECVPSQVAAARHVRETAKKAAQGRAKLGVEAFAEALLGVPKILAENSGFDAQVG